VVTAHGACVVSSHDKGYELLQYYFPKHVLSALYGCFLYGKFYPFLCNIFFLLALQPPMGVVFYSPLVGFSLLAYEVS